MMRPARMVRLAVLAPHTREREVIEALHAAQAFHLEEFHEGALADLKLGAPLPEGSRSSERLVRIRSVIRHLGLGDEDLPEAPVPADDVRGRLDEALVTIENNVDSAVEARDRIAHELESRLEERALLEPVRDLGLAIDDLSGYERVRIILGEAEPDVAARVLQVSPNAGVVRGAAAQALFIPLRDADRVSEVLSGAGFRDLEIPRGSGSVREALGRIEADIKILTDRLETARAGLERLRRDYAQFLLAAEEDLSIEVAKAELPLAFGHSERAFVVDAWVPAEREAELRQTLEGATRGACHIEVLDGGDRHEHHRTIEPPTQYEHPRPIRPFAFFLDLFSTPKYGEIDPTLVLFIVFPFFFGFMIGDLGYGILMLALGLLAVVRLGKKSDVARGLGAALLLGGIWASFFGGVVFHDAFGIPFVAHAPDDLAWFGAEGGHGELAPLLGITVSEHSRLAHPILEKLADEDVKSMLALSIIAAFVHLTLGFAFAFVNHWTHSKKHALAQAGWMAVLIGFFILIVNMSATGAPNPVSEWTLGAMGRPEILTVGVPFIVAGAVVLFATEGAMGAMEILGLLSHTISYTRLAGIAVAKGAMAVAFNGLFLRDMALHGAGPLIVVGLLLFIVAQLLVFVLGMLSSGIQAIRLNYVEFFLKFYKGGGATFSPFGRSRKYSVAASQIS